MKEHITFYTGSGGRMLPQIPYILYQTACPHIDSILPRYFAWEVRSFSNSSSNESNTSFSALFSPFQRVRQSGGTENWRHRRLTSSDMPMKAAKGTYFCIAVWISGYEYFRTFGGSGKLQLDATGIKGFPRLFSGFFFCGASANAGHGLLINEVSRSHTTTRHSR